MAVARVRNISKGAMAVAMVRNIGKGGYGSG